MWILIFGGAAVAAIAGFAYLCNRVYRFLPSPTAIETKSQKRLRMFTAVGIGFAAAFLFAALLGYINAVIIVIHTVVFWLLSDLLFFVIAKFRGKPFRLNYSACVAVMTAFVYLTVGFVLANDVWATKYTVYSDKIAGDLRVVMFADSHIGVTFDGKEFEKHVARMQSYSPDVVVIAGDFVDDDTSRKDVDAACRALGKLKTTYGVYYVFGNHDKGYYSDSMREYDAEHLVSQLTSNGVTVLQDDIVELNSEFCVIGRQDASESERGNGRADIAELIEKTDKSMYSIVLNHQPTDYAAESAAGADLVLSGHTHGGQMVPIGLISDIFGLNDSTYGRERRGNTEFIVTSGISDWAIKFKTGCRSEFAVIDIIGKKAA